MHVCIKASRDNDEIGTEMCKTWQDMRIERLAKLCAIVAGRERRIDDVAVFAARNAGAGTRKPWHLVAECIEDRRVRPENFLGSIAMMYIEIKNRHALR